MINFAFQPILMDHHVFRFPPGADLIKLFWSKIYSKIQKKINPLLCG